MAKRRRNYIRTENHILNLFSKHNKFTHEGNEYIILDIGKPRPKSSGGECKTDLYILCKVNNEKKEFKISIKQENADFLENKISYERAVELFGSNTDEVLIDSIEQIKNSFLKEPLINISKYGRTNPNCIKIGWRYELVNKKSGNRSAEIILSDKQKIDVFSGQNLNINKRNSVVNNQTIENSGVANYILIVGEEPVNNLDHYIQNLQDIDDYAVGQNIYYACKAVNYRANKDKWDGDRPLAVYCEWFINKDGKLDGKLVFDKPLKKKANEVGNNIRALLMDLKIDYTNFHEIKNNISETTNLYK